MSRMSLLVLGGTGVISSACVREALGSVWRLRFSIDIAQPSAHCPNGSCQLGGGT